MGTRIKQRTEKFAKIKEAILTPRGKGIAAGLALVILVLAVVLVATFAIPGPSIQPPATTSGQGNNVQNQESSSTAQAANENTSTPSIPESTGTVDISGFRDPFEPLIESTSSAFTASGSSQESTQTGSGDELIRASDTLYLADIFSRDGQQYATVIYKGQAYDVKAGDMIDSSPFQVIDIGDGSITILYGDNRLTLQLGEQIVK